MNYWQTVASRVNVPGLLLLALGVVLSFGAPRLSRWLGKWGGDRAILPMKVAGLVLAVLGAIVALQILPI